MATAVLQHVRYLGRHLGFFFLNQQIAANFLEIGRNMFLLPKIGIEFTLECKRRNENKFCQVFYLKL